MAEIDTVRSRLAELKRQGKTESTSKEAGKLSKRLSELKSGGATGTKIGSELGTDLSSALAQAREAIIGQGNVLGQQQTLATSRELGRRGILPNTGLGEQEIATAQRPITAATQSALGNLGVQGANLFEQQRQFDLQNQLAQQAQALQQRQFEQATLPSTMASIQNLQSQIANRGTDTSAASQLMALLGLGGSGVTGTQSSGLQPPQMSGRPGAIVESPPGSGVFWEADAQGVFR